MEEALKRIQKGTHWKVPPASGHLPTEYIQLWHILFSGYSWQQRRAPTHTHTHTTHELIGLHWNDVFRYYNILHALQTKPSIITYTPLTYLSHRQTDRQTILLAHTHKQDKLSQHSLSPSFPPCCQFAPCCLCCRLTPHTHKQHIFSTSKFNTKILDVLQYELKPYCLYKEKKSTMLYLWHEI